MDAKLALRNGTAGLNLILVVIAQERHGRNTEISTPQVIHELLSDVSTLR